MPARRFTTYESPLVARNASPEMAALFSPSRRIETWRSLWIALADSQRRLGLPISARQIAQLKRAAPRVDWAAAARHERRVRHDVMAHVLTFADAAPLARGIIHLGATSADISDNADLILLREALGLIRDRLVNVIDRLGSFARRHRRLPTLGFTHFQPAQLTTVGKRAALWCADLIMDLQRLEFELQRIKFRGIKGATGTQASFLALFDGNAAKVRRLETLVARRMGFRECYPVVGQTYPRKVDAAAVGVLADIAVSVHKTCNDLRLLAHLKEVEEPVEAGQIGSSAMAYKRNPMRCERATALARLVMSLATSPPATAAEQWFERTLDDSANRRVVIPEAFLATDGALRILANVTSGLNVYPQVIAARIREELPQLATENILMAAVRRGGDRQTLHERIRRHARRAAEQLQRHGRPNDLLERLRGDPLFDGVDLRAVLDPRGSIGLAVQQTDEFLRQQVEPLRRKYRRVLGQSHRLEV
jgi:adenylosuccinate lyase